MVRNAADRLVTGNRFVIELILKFCFLFLKL